MTFFLVVLQLQSTLNHVELLQRLKPELLELPLLAGCGRALKTPHANRETCQSFHCSDVSLDKKINWHKVGQKSRRSVDAAELCAWPFKKFLLQQDQV